MDNKHATSLNNAYLAGILDTRLGSIKLQKYRTGHGVFLQPSVQILCGDAGFTAHIKNLLKDIGVGPYIQQVDRVGQDPGFQIQISKPTHIKRLLLAIAPYSVGKQGEVQLVLDYLRSKDEPSETTREAPKLATLDEDIVHPAVKIGG